ncbi:hypothetical protein BH24BAC1_BH24BAC1_03880 [soil metagenome]|jgi:hypothetical protein
MFLWQLLFGTFLDFSVKQTSPYYSVLARPIKAEQPANKRILCKP